MSFKSFNSKKIGGKKSRQDYKKWWTKIKVNLIKVVELMIRFLYEYKYVES